MNKIIKEPNVVVKSFDQLNKLRRIFLIIKVLRY